MLLVDVCSQPTEPGPCSNIIHRWAFIPKAGRCKRFNYGGCFGNENNFDSKEKCNKRCPPVITGKVFLPLYFSFLVFCGFSKLRD